MRILARGMALVIMAVGAVGIVAPSGVVWIARHSLTSGAFYVIAVVRIAFGLVLISLAPASRAPMTLRVIGSFVLIAGIATALTGMAAMENARGIIDWWIRQGDGSVRLTSVLLLGFGGLLAWACSPGDDTEGREGTD